VADVEASAVAVDVLQDGGAVRRVGAGDVDAREALAVGAADRMEALVELVVDAADVDLEQRALGLGRQLGGEARRNRRVGREGELGPGAAVGAEVDEGLVDGGARWRGSGRRGRAA